jgi:hypothetical protein
MCKKGLFLNNLTQIWEVGGLPWRSARAKEVEYKGVTEGRECMKNLPKCCYMIYGWSIV